MATNGTVPVGTAVSGGQTTNGIHPPLRTAALPQPPAAQGATRQSLVLTNQTPIVFSKEDKPGNFVFQKDSAGLGVPRGSLGNLNKISNDVGRHGFASMEVYATGAGATNGANRGPVTLRAGSPEGMAERGSAYPSSGARQGSFNQGQSTGAQAASRGGGGTSQPAMGGGGGASGGGSNGGAHGAVASPK